MKYILSIALLAASLSVHGSDMGSLKPGARPAPAEAALSQSPLQAPAKAAGKANFYTITADTQGAYLSSFTAGYSSVLSNVMDIDYAAGFSGTSIDNDFYYCDYTTNASGGITAVNWKRVDVAGKKVEFSKSQATANAVCMDMTYDVTTSTIYGMSAMADVIVTIDPATGNAEFAFETLPFYTLAADGAGQLYGILLEDNGEAALYSINKVTGNALKIGNTGVKMLSSGGLAYFQTAAFSRADGRLYWLTPSQTGTDLYRVDVASGRASNLCTLNTMEALCLFDLPGESASDSPAQVANLKAKADGMTVHLSFDAPSTTVDNKPLGSLSSIDIYRGNATEAAHSISAPTPGTSYNWSDTEAKSGFNTYRLVAVNDKGESLPVYASVFCGVDYPNAPTSVVTTIETDGYPTLTWTAPTKGINGLDIDPSLLSYNIYRDAAGTEELIAKNIKATSYHDTGLDLSRQAYSYYYVSAVSEAGEGRKSAPAGAHTGPAYKLPFEEAFVEGTPSTSPWTMQSIALGGAWEIGIVSNAPGTGPHVGSGMLIFKGFTGVAEGAEARIVSPILSFEGVSAELRFHFFHADFGEDMHFDDHLVVEVSVDGGDFEPIPGADLYQYTANTRWTEYTFALDKYARQKNVRIGFHGISAAGMDLVVDNIRVLAKAAGIEDVDADAQSPAEYYNLQGIRVDNPGRGIYIRRQGNTTSKVIVR